MMNKKRIMAFLMAVVMILNSGCLFIEKVKASEIVESGSCGENVTYTLDSEGTLTISGTGEIKYVSYINSVKNVVIINGVTSIGDSAFYGCSGLTSIEIPSSVTYIESNAFYASKLITIYGESNSYAEEYANKNNIPFIAYNSVIAYD